MDAEPVGLRLRENHGDNPLVPGSKYRISNRLPGRVLGGCPTVREFKLIIRLP